MGDGCLLARSFVGAVRVRSLNVLRSVSKMNDILRMSDRGRSFSTWSFDLGSLCNQRESPDSGNRCLLVDVAGVRAPRPLRRYFAPARNGINERCHATANGSSTFRSFRKRAPYLSLFVSHAVNCAITNVRRANNEPTLRPPENGK